MGAPKGLHFDHYPYNNCQAFNVDCCRNLVNIFYPRLGGFIGVWLTRTKLDIANIMKHFWYHPG